MMAGIELQNYATVHEMSRIFETMDSQHSTHNEHEAQDCWTIGGQNTTNLLRVF